jgi:pyruvate/2-oxoglutarate/acetoin dehydrogenase E1 component
MNSLAADPLVRFIGYGVRYGGKAAGTLRHVPESQLLETPVAENLMVGLAIGLALRGLRPVVYIERYDFILNALDAIVNHLDKIERMSEGAFAPAIILRVVAGNVLKPLFTGLTHTQDFTASLRHMVSFPVLDLKNAAAIQPAYLEAHEDLRARKGFIRSTLLVEYKDLI